MDMLKVVIASEAKQSIWKQEKLDCFVASLLAMTNEIRDTARKVD
jgi:hypothetical protein